MKYLYEKDGVVYAECEECGRVLKFKKYELDDVKTGVECFCGNVSNEIKNMPSVRHMTSMNANTSQPVTSAPRSSRVVTTTAQIPRCPTCGSTNVKKISLTSKAFGGAVFGLFSSNVRNTFKCEDCGYKW